LVGQREAIFQRQAAKFAKGMVGVPLGVPFVFFESLVVRYF